MHGFLVFSVCALVAGISLSTYIRNMDWRSEKSLWQDAMIKAPESARPLHNLAWGYYSPTGQTEEAIRLYKQSLQLQDDTIGFEATTFFNLAGIYYSKLNDDKKAVEYAAKTLLIDPGHRRAVYVLAGALARLGRHEEALAHLERMPGASADSANNLYLKGLLYLKTQDPENALTIFRRCLKLTPNHWQYQREIGFALSLLHHHDRAYWFFRRAEKHRPNEPDLLMGLAGNYLIRGLPLDAHACISRWIKVIGPDNVEFYLDAQIDNPMGLPVPYEILTPLISELLLETSDRYKDMAHRLQPDFKTKDNDAENEDRADG